MKNYFVYLFGMYVKYFYICGLDKNNHRVKKQYHAPKNFSNQRRC